MRKTFHVSKKRILFKYNKILFILNLPSISLLISFLAIVMIFYIIDSENVTIPDILNEYIFYGTYFCILYSFIVCFVGSIISDVCLKAHMKHTYIEIADSNLVVSQHSQTVFRDGKPQSYKKLWIVDLKTVEQVECVKNHLFITADARFFHENADWLSYESGADGIDFDNWWYNSNGGKNVNFIEVTDFYTFGERIAKRIRFCSDKIIAREQRREKFRREMLEIAANTHHQRGISEKYTPPKYRTFR